MRSTLARIIAVAALIPLVSTVWNFIDLAQQTYSWDGVAVPRETFVVLGDGIVAPTLLFGVAAIVEMLFRIAERSPLQRADLDLARAPEVKPWRWGSVIARVLLIAAALSAIADVWTVLDLVNGAALTDMPQEHRDAALVRGIVNAVVEALWVVGLAAAVEYLSRIAHARSSEARPT